MGAGLFCFLSIYVVIKLYKLKKASLKNPDAATGQRLPSSLRVVPAIWLHSSAVTRSVPHVPLRVATFWISDAN